MSLLSLFKNIFYYLTQKEPVYQTKKLKLKDIDIPELSFYQQIEFNH